ncbi:unnamed protein product [Lactuca virosa]|uniref:Uncharacterized protein n=1 Tax=Lactuca virosa TaxID=75947 RepID=A0AAU9PRQ0_9ASTR|nr:unnamed protein product [Lactuca virosa]
MYISNPSVSHETLLKTLKFHELKPRTYRINVGHFVHIGGPMRLDIEESSVDSIYVTVWASHHLPLHMEKPEKAMQLLCLDGRNIQYYRGWTEAPLIGRECRQLEVQVIEIVTHIASTTSKLA